MERGRRGQITIAVLLVGLVASSAVGVASVLQLKRADEETAAAQAPLSAAYVLLGALKDAETGQRGFALTGMEQFLEPYAAALPKIGPALARVEQLSAGDRELREHAGRLRALVSQKLAHLARSVVVRRRDGATAAAEVTASGDGKRAMDAIRAEVAHVERLQALRLAQAEARHRRYANWAHTAVWIAAATGFAFGVLLLVAIRRLLAADAAAARAEFDGRAAREREAWFKSLAECANVGIFVVDAERRTRFRNSTMEALTGVTIAEMPTPAADAIFPDDVRHERDELLARVASGERTGSGETTIQRPDGERRRVLVRWAPLDGAPGGEGMTIVSATDVTETHLARARIRELARRIERARDDEAAKLAHRLHEGVAQDLYAAKLQLAFGRRHGERRETALDRLDSVITTVLAELRDISQELRPAGLASLPLARLVATHSEVFGPISGLEIDVRIDDERATLGPEAKWMLLRATREALANVAKHAGASRVEIVGCVHGAEFVLTVSDDGRGIAPAAQHHVDGIGLLGISERAAELGGTSVIERLVPQGTRLTVRLPRERRARRA